MSGTPSTYEYDRSSAKHAKGPVEGVFNDVKRDFPDAWAKVLRSHGDDGEFNIRVAFEARRRSIPCWLNGKRGDQNDLSRDILVFENETGVHDSSGRLSGLTLVDFIVGHEGPNAHFGWLDVTVVPHPVTGELFMPPAASVEPSNLGGGPKKPDIALLGRSWFCFMRGLQNWRTETLANYHWLLDNEGTDVFRVMLAVEGIDHIPRDSGWPDPWRDAGVPIDAPWWDDRFKEMLDIFGSDDKLAWITPYGGRNQTPTEDSRRRLNDRIAANCEGRWKAVLGFEPCNEFRVNRWTSAQVREIGRDLRSKIPTGMLMALSAPHLSHNFTDSGREPTDADMLASMGELYGGDGAGANCMTIHVMRDARSKWSRMESYKHLMPHLPKINNEPPGQGASAGGDTNDVATLVGHYVETNKAGSLLHVTHNAWGVTNGRLPGEYHNGRNETQNIWDHKNQTELSHGLKVVREGGSVTPGPIPVEPIPGPTQNDKLLPGQSLLPGQRLISPAGVCYMEYQHDGNLVVHNTVEGHPVWASGTDGVSLGSVQMQHDGNLVMYDGTGNPIRATRTEGHPGSMFQLQDDGNFVLYDSGQPIWASASSEFFS